MRLVKLVTGGQTGVDRAVLDFALLLNIPYGGWVPAGGLAEDFPKAPGLLEKYPRLVETETADPAVRTEKNVIDSTATLAIKYGRMSSPGTDLAMSIAEELGRPSFLYRGDNFQELLEWLDSLTGRVVLNVAGQKESEAAQAYAHTFELFSRIFKAPVALKMDS